MREASVRRMFARRRLVGWSVGLLGALAAGCASAPAPAGPVALVSGTWEGRITPTGPVLGQPSPASGPVRMELRQRGAWVEGSISGPGFTGGVSGELHGNRLSGSFDGETLAGAAVSVSAVLDGVFKGDTLAAVLDYGGRMTLKRLR